MTTELAPIADALTKVDLATQKNVVFFEGRKSELIIEDTPAWLERMSNGEGQYEPVVKPERLKSFQVLAKAEIENVDITHILIPTGGSIVVGGSGLAALAPIILDMAGGEPNIFTAIIGLSAFFGITVLPASIGGLVYHKSKLRKQIQFYKDNLPSFDVINRHGLRLWLNAKYDIQVDDGTLHGIYNAVSGYADTARFISEDGKIWSFAKDSEHETWFVKPWVAGTKKVTRQHSLISKRQLPNEASDLYDSVKQLNTQFPNSVSVETQHVRSRAMKDARAAVDDYWKLVDMGAEKAGRQGLMPILSLLHDELTDRLQEEVAQVLRNQRIQKEYLHSQVAP